MLRRTVVSGSIGLTGLIGTPGNAGLPAEGVHVRSHGLGSPPSHAERIISYFSGSSDSSDKVRGKPEILHHASVFRSGGSMFAFPDATGYSFSSFFQFRFAFAEIHAKFSIDRFYPKFWYEVGAAAALLLL